MLAAGIVAKTGEMMECGRRVLFLPNRTTSVCAGDHLLQVGREFGRIEEATFPNPVGRGVPASYHGSRFNSFARHLRPT